MAKYVNTQDPHVFDGTSYYEWKKKSVRSSLEEIQIHPGVLKKDIKEIKKIYRVRLNDGTVYPLEEEDLKIMISTNNFNGYENCSIIGESGEHYKITESCDFIQKNTLPIDHPHMLEEFSSIYDIFGKKIIDDLNDIDIPDKIEGKKIINLEKVLLLLNKPVLFHEMSKMELCYNYMDQLLSCLILEPDQFDELFTIKVGEPESPLLKQYLIKLSEIISVEIKENEEIDKNKLEEAEKEAYEFSGYRGKSLEIVKNEAKDYHNYFRFLLTCKEKIAVSEQEVEYAMKMSLIIKKDQSDSFSKVKEGAKINNKITGIINGVEDFYFEEVIPYMKRKSSNILVKSILYFDGNIKDFNSNIENLNIDIKLALYHELITKSFDSLIKGGHKVIMSLLVCDKYYNHFNYKEIKYISKYKKRMYNILSNIDQQFKLELKYPLGFTDRLL